MLRIIFYGKKGFFPAEVKAAAVIPSAPLGKVVRNRIAAIAASKAIPWAHIPAAMWRESPGEIKEQSRREGTNVERGLGDDLSVFLPSLFFWEIQPPGKIFPFPPSRLGVGGIDLAGLG